MTRPVNIALVDSSTLVGKGVKSHLAIRRFPVGRVRLFDTGAVEEGGNLSEFAGEPALATRPDREEMERMDLAFYCGRAGSGKEYLGWAGRGGFGSKLLQEHGLVGIIYGGTHVEEDFRNRSVADQWFENRFQRSMKPV
mgnify:CR=1 FL=1